MIFAGFLRKAPVEMVQCKTIKNMQVPAHSEIVLEGYVDPREGRTESTIRRSHWLLLACRSVSGVPPYVPDASRRPDLSRDYRGKATYGGLLPG